MPNPVNYLPNETALKRILADVEATYGAGGTPDFSMYGDLSINKQKPLVRTSDEARGSYARMRNPRRGPVAIDGTLSKRLSFEDLAILARFFAKSGGGTAVSDAETIPGFTRIAALNDGALDSFMAEHFVDGMPFVAKGIRMNEVTISGDVDDADANWMLSSALLVQSNDLKATTRLTATSGTTLTHVDSGASYTVNEHAGKYAAVREGTADNIGSVVEILSNTATAITFAQPLPAAVVSGDVIEISGLFTAGVADRTVDYIATEGTRIWIDDVDTDLGETELVDKLISWSVTIGHSFGRKRFQNNVGSYSKKQRRGARLVTAQFVMEFDDWYEYKNWDTDIPIDRAIRIEKEGPVIDAGAGTHKLAQINLPRVQWDEVNPNNERDGNITAVYQALAYTDDSYGSEMDIVTKTTLATLP